MRVVQLNKIKKNEKLSGAHSGVFNPGAEAVALLPNADYGTLFAYLFRRFGMPNFGWDDHKMLVDYILTTPIKGVYLTVSPRPSGLNHAFGYLLTNDLNKQCYAEQFAPINEWNEAFKRWKSDVKKIAIIDTYDFNPAQTELKKAIDYWNETHPEWNGIDGGEEEHKLIREFWRTKSEELREEFSLIFSPPKNTYSVELGREFFPLDSLRFKINEALIYTIKNLLRPVYVRDVPINACGLVDGSKINNSVNYHKEAGNGLQYFIEKAKAA